MMKEMYFDNILIADIVEKTAHFHKFEKGFNVVTSQDFEIIVFCYGCRSRL